MDRLDLELYAERLAHYRERILDDLAHARMRESWSDFEDSARDRLDPHETARLVALGVLAPEGAAVAARETTAERAADLVVLEHLQLLVEHGQSG